jgi:hypothetical protein
MTYSEWIAAYVERHNGAVLGLCRQAVVEMRETFPELTEVRGHVYCAWGKRGHAWLVDPAGEIVDPTRAQFPGIIQYEPWKPGDEVRVGKCMECGDDIWRPIQSLDEDPGHASVCSKECEDALMAEYGGTRR